MRSLWFTEEFECVAGDWTSQEWEAHMGTSHEMGRNEGCIWWSTVPPVVQSIHRPASAALNAVDPRSPRGPWVFCLRAWQTDATHKNLTIFKERFLTCLTWPELRRTSTPWGGPSCVGDWGGKQPARVGPQHIATPSESSYCDSYMVL